MERRTNYLTCASARTYRREIEMRYVECLVLIVLTSNKHIFLRLAHSHSLFSIKSPYCIRKCFICGKKKLSIAKGGLIVSIKLNLTRSF